MNVIREENDLRSQYYCKNRVIDTNDGLLIYETPPGESYLNVTFHLCP
jgi:hypothetical protein